ncbi:ABC transporter permease [Azospirillum agricola]|uniref:ABC transporter permease n=1 Tax=Azospirillum agricola TaxID=1720247 RepID=UPI000A0F2A7D|nr:ABC transporter permease subunit [Azospirillum agricola]SMH30969.1 ABC-type nitrate/sulfonate/bicarbonate transport system, permease component [Azospirillum lipoferum]
MKPAGVVRLLITAGAVLLLEAACRSGMVGRGSMIPPSEMLAELVRLMGTDGFWTQIGSTLRNILAAAVAAMVAGFAGGATLHAFPRVRRAVEPLIASYYALPFFVLYPLFIVLFGMNAVPIIAMGFLYAVMAMVTGTLAGLDRIPPVLRKVGRTYRLGRLQDALLIQLPAAGPHIFTGVKLALSYSVTGVIGAEFILASSGLGYSISFAYNNLQDRTMYALLLFVVVFVSTLTVLLHWAEQKVHHRSGAGRGAAARGDAGMAEKLIAGGVIALLILGAWQVFHGLAGDEALASPLVTAQRLGSLFGNPVFWANVTETAQALGLSLLISCLGGGLAGLLIGASRSLSDVLEPLFVTLYAIPKVTLYPVILLFFGLGMPAKVAFGALHGFIPMMLVTMGAIRAMNPVLRRSARAMRLSPMQTLSTILVPATVPEIVTGLRISFSITLLGVMVGEMFASKRGLGFMIMNGISVNDTATMMSVTVLIGLFAVVVNSALLALDHRMHRA